MDKRGLKYIGQTYLTNEGYVVEVIDYIDRDNVVIKLNDNTILTRRMSIIKNGQVKNPNHRTVCGVGYTGEGEYNRCVDNKHTQASRLWKGMIERCYGNSKKKYKTYDDCTVVEEWHNFQNFARWYEDNYYEVEGQEMHLDKDILNKGNKVYGPETCVFVPEYINSLFTKRQNHRGKYPIGVHYTSRGNKYISQLSSSGERIYLGRYNTPEEAFEVYKEYKENEIKRVVDRFKDKIPKELYSAMYDYRVEITD